MTRARTGSAPHAGAHYVPMGSEADLVVLGLVVVGALAGLLGAVEHGSDDPAADLLDLLLEAADLLAVALLGVGHHQEGVGPGGRGPGGGHDQGRRAVQDDEVEQVALLLEELAHGVGVHQRRGVRGQRPRQDHPQVGRHRPQLGGHLAAVGDRALALAGGGARGSWRVRGGVPPVSRLERPVLLDRPKNWWTRGRRRSAETSSTSLPVSASTTARLAAVVLLPSPTPAETTITELMSSWADRRAMRVRRVR